jgi:DeoR/GlpR family transcriptional regulator of sugar metabolism
MGLGNEQLRQHSHLRRHDRSRRERFDVSPQTIRKDLNELCDQRVLMRIHGGAVAASAAHRFIPATSAQEIFLAFGSMRVALQVAQLECKGPE